MTEHIKQNNIALNKDIREIGCFFRSCGIVAENKTGKSLTIEDINKTWEWAKDTKRIDASLNVRDSASIITRFLRVLGDQSGHFVEVGTFKDGVISWYPSIKKYNPELCKADALIQKIKQNGKNKTHFIVVDKYGNLVEDPHEPPIHSQGVFYSILYAYV